MNTFYSERMTLSSVCKLPDQQPLCLDSKAACIIFYLMCPSKALFFDYLIRFLRTLKMATVWLAVYSERWSTTYSASDKAHHTTKSEYLSSDKASWIRALRTAAFLPASSSSLQGDPSTDLVSCARSGFRMGDTECLDDSSSSAATSDFLCLTSAWNELGEIWHTQVNRENN